MSSADLDRAMGQSDSWSVWATVTPQRRRSVVLLLAQRSCPASDPEPTRPEGLFVRGELVMICNAALAERGLMNTRALVTHILEAKGLDGGDRVLAKSVAERLIHALRMQAKRCKIEIAGKERGAIVWAAR